MTKFELENLRTLAASAEVMERVYTSHFKLFYPRRYSAPGTHYSPRLMAGSYCSLAVSVQDTDFFQRIERDWTLNCTIVIAARLAALRMPTYWVTKEFTEMVMEAEPPKDMVVSEIEWPLEGLTVMLPNETLFDPSGSPVMWMSFVRAETGMDMRLSPTNNAVIENQLNGMSMCAYTASGCYYAQTLPNDAVLTAPQLNAIQYGEGLKAILGADTDVERIAITPEEDAKFNVRLSGMAANILMYMMAMKCSEPNLAEGIKAVHEGGEARKAKPQKDIDAMWYPSWIGRDYHHPSECKHLGGTHASPRTHWRVSHYRRQHYGVGRQQTKIIHIPRKLVNVQPPAQTATP